MKFEDPSKDREVELFNNALFDFVLHYCELQYSSFKFNLFLLKIKFLLKINPSIYKYYPIYL